MTDLERLTRALQLIGPDEFPTDYYRYLAEHYISLDPPPQPDDGPEYHADFAFWMNRQLARPRGVQVPEDRVE